ncbi:hypothetical protein C2869_13750 [Saccharobesus litoralis]|uniref:Inner membrane protein YejM N-terminal domain-containing protein n=1 Tax=Saccharobesus litoralis TaxID=2172099 RepID=A0A2S0VT91_9ALTE|nr:DUF3413 domain-containing protein [Saccharobesus litoralis]AWB67438.1 hypothetical protein C2869_13750 [Saccharobesus litoralis]
MWLNSAQRQSQIYSWGHWFSICNIFIGLFVSSIYLFSEPLPSGILATLYILVYWVGHVAFIFFLIHILAIFPVISISKNQGFNRIWAASVSTAGLSLLFIDSVFYSANHYHLDLMSPSNIQSDVSFLVETIPAGFIAAIFVLFAAILSIEIALCNKLWRDLDSIRERFVRFKIVHALLSCFFISHLVHIWADAKVYQPIISKDNLLPLSYPLTAKSFLSNTGLIDLNEYREKRELLFDVSNYHLAVPPAPLNCQQPSEDMGIAFIKVDSELYPQLEHALKRQFRLNTDYWAPGDAKQTAFELLYGMPNLYSSLLNQPSILHTALRSEFIGLQQNPAAANISSELGLNINDPEPSQHDNNLFVNLFEVKSQPALSYALDAIKAFGSLPQIVIVKQSDELSLGKLFIAGAKTLPPLVSNYDIVPSVVNGWLKCDWNNSSNPFGRDLFANNVEQRDWFISANSQTISVWDSKQVTTIDSKAKLSAFSLQGGQADMTPHSNSVLARAIGHLKQYLAE